jgi:hypothetical protein
VKREFGELASFGRRGRFAGVAWLTRALGSSGESGRPSCSAVQQSFDAMMEGWVRMSEGFVLEVASLLTFASVHVEHLPKAKVEEGPHDTMDDHKTTDPTNGYNTMENVRKEEAFTAPT